MRRLLSILILLMPLVVHARNERDTLGVGTMVSFTENVGQWQQEVRYEAQLHNAALFLEVDGITIALRDPLPHPGVGGKPLRAHAYRMHFVGAEGAGPVASEPLAGYSNYFLGNDESKWRSGVKSYATVRYAGLYQGVDLEMYTASNALKYNFIVAPGADPTQIVVEYEGADGLHVTSEGHLVVRTSVRDVVELKPYVFQRVGGKEQEVASRWVVNKGNRVSISVGKYDVGAELVIDPVLIFSTYTGSTADNWGTTATYDSHKNAYSAGLVFAMGYPTSLGAFDTTYNGNVDIGIFKFDSVGHNRLFATFLGGAYADMPHSLYVNTFDELIIFGTTGSSNFPTTAGAFQRNFLGGPAINYESTSIPYPQGSDLFVSLFSSDGQHLLASTFVGGSGNDGLNYRNYYNTNAATIMFGNDTLYYNYGDGARGEIITDNLNNVYVGTSSLSFDFPTTSGCVQSSLAGGQDGVVFKLDYNLRTLLWSTYLGGMGDDAVYSIDVDSAYNLLVCGGTVSRNFPTTAGAYQTTYNGGTADGFVSKISYHGDRLMASSYFGSSAYDQVYFVRTGRHDEVLLFGQTRASGNTMVYNAGYSVPGAGMFLARLYPDLSGRVWSTVFGTPGRVNLSPTAFAADICNRVYAAGWGRDFVGYNGVQWNSQGTWGMETSANAYSDVTDGQDFYIISIDDDASNLEYATFFGELHEGTANRGGGDHVDGGTSRFDKLATLYQAVCASCGSTNNFPTTAGAWSNSNMSSNCNNAVFRFNVTDNFPVAEFIPPAIGCVPYTVHLQNTGRGTSYHWDFGDGTTSTQASPTHTYATSGIYTITLIATMPNGCSAADTVRHTVQVIDNVGRTLHPLVACNNTSTQIGPQPQIGASYYWTGNVSDPTVANPWVETDGTYILRITGDGCTEYDTFIVETYSLIDSWHTTPISCQGRSDGTATFVTPSGILADSISFSIAPAAITTVADSHTVVFSQLPAGNYTVTISGYGCTYEQTFTLSDPEPPAYKKETSAVLCSDTCSGWIHIQYALDDNDTQLQADTLLSNLCEGTYITQLTSHGCPFSDTTTIIRDRSLDNFRAWADRYHIYLGEKVTLHATSASPSPDITYSWTPSHSLNNPTSPNPIATPTDPYSCYTATATTPAGCTASDTVCLQCTEVICGAPLFTIPNAFTPNDDGINDRLCFNSENIVHFYIAIFSRWGEKVYESEDINACWDGTYRHAPCLPGVYTYTCHIECHAGITNDFKGDITLIR